MKVLFISLLMLGSCTRYAEVSREGISTSIRGIEMEIKDLTSNKWKVGQNRASKVSDSISFLLELPKLKESDLDFLTARFGVNAWIIRVIYKRGSFEQDLGSTYTLFRTPQLGRISRGGGPAGMVTLKVFYAAKYASERFRSFKCPAFGHNKLITDYQINGESAPFEINLNHVTTYEEKSQLIGLTPSAFNAGHSLQGNFYVEIAPYDSVQKKLHGSFKRIPQHISVLREETVHVQGCAGVSPENQ
jgi:hypothetical protein